MTVLKGDRLELALDGSFDVIVHGANVVRPSASFVVVNAYTQFDYRGPRVRVDYDAVASAMREVRERFSGRRIGYPRIGAGLAGGDWSRLSAIIERALSGEDHALVELPS